MNLESDAEFQDYINQLCKKTQEFKTEETSSDEISPPSYLSSISKATSDRSKTKEIKNGTKNDHEQPTSKIKNPTINNKSQNNGKHTRQRKQSVTNNIYSIQEKQLDRFVSSESEGISKNKSASRSDKYKTESSKVSTARTDEILNLNNVMSFNDLVNINENNKTIDDVTENSELNDIANADHSTTSNGKIIKNTRPQGMHYTDKPTRQAHSPVDQEDESKNIFHATSKSELQRQSSTSSLLLQREGVFYSTSADKKRKNSILVFKDEVVWARESNEGSNNITDSKTSQAESIEEDLPAPEVKQKTNKDPQDSMLSKGSAKKELEGSASSWLNKHYIEKESEEPLAGHTAGNSNDQGRASKQEIERIKAHVSKQERPRKKVDLKSSYRLKEHHSSSAIKSKTRPTNILHSRTSSLTEHSMEENYKASSTESPIEKKYKSSKHKSSYTSSSSSSSSSLSFKIKYKRSQKHKRKLKDKDLLVELITKTILKVLPKLYLEAHSCSAYPMRGAFVPSGLPYTSVGMKAHNLAMMTPSHGTITTARIDDALRQTVALTRQFLDTHQTLYEAYNYLLETDSKHISMKNVEEISRSKAKSTTLNNAYRLIEEMKNRKRNTKLNKERK